MSTFPMALEPPLTASTPLTLSMLKTAASMAQESPRKRIIQPLHKTASDSLHRMFNVIQPGSYIRPHSHQDQHKAESIIVLRGSICYITFDANGNIINYLDIAAGSEVFGIDAEPTVIHTFYALEEDTTIFEVKPGPYIKTLDKGFATWAPEEGTPEAEIYLKELMQATAH